MFEQAQVMFLFAETPVHAGTGISLGVVDLPIQREGHTEYPIIQASGVKGAIRDWFERKLGKKTAEVDAIFGPESISRDEDAFAGAASFTDARTTVFAVRSLRGVFAFVTSELALHRLALDLQRTGVNPGWALDRIKVGSTGSAALACKGTTLSAKDTIILEEFAFKAQVNEELGKVAAWLADRAFPKDAAYDYWREKMRTDLLVLPENAFRDFLKMSTDVQAHICIDEKTRTVKNGALFYEESLPCDTLLVTTVLAMRPGTDKGPASAGDVLAKLRTLDQQRIQMGGKATLGRGLMAVRFVEAPAAK